MNAQAPLLVGSIMGAAAFAVLAAALAVFVPDDRAPTLRQSAVITVLVIARWAGDRWRAYQRPRMSPQPQPAAPGPDLAPAAAGDLALFAERWAAVRLQRVLELEAGAFSEMPPAADCPETLYPDWPEGGFAAWVAAGEPE